MGKYLLKYDEFASFSAAQNSAKYVMSIEPGVAYAEDTEQVFYNPFTNGYDYVDLALPSGTLWATKNIGAASLEDAGDYFRFGEIEPVSGETWPEYKWGDLDHGSPTKYNSEDGLTTLELQDDAANAIMGGQWHIPSKSQFQELVCGTTSAITTIDETRYIVFTSKVNDSKLYFPFAELDSTVLGLMGNDIQIDGSGLYEYEYGNIMEVSTRYDDWVIRVGTGRVYYGYRLSAFNVRGVIG